MSFGAVSWGESPEDATGRQGQRQEHGINMMQCEGKVIIKVVKEVLRTYLEVFISSFGHKQQVTVEKGHTDVGERKCRKVLWK